MAGLAGQSAINYMLSELVMNERRTEHRVESIFRVLNRIEQLDMNDLLELQEKATKRVHWPTGLTYACEHHATALKKIALSMKIHITIDDYIEGERLCSNCLNENSIAKGDADKS